VIDGRACDIRFAGNAKAGRVALEPLLPHLDVIVQTEAHRHRRLLIADMDSTMITVECIDELADYVGLKAEVSAVTEAAMRGELDFAQALHSRVKLLAGLSEAKVAECLRERVRIMPGAVDLIAAFKAAGGRAVLVSGGFTHFTDSVALEIGFDRAVANRLVVKDGALTGEVETPIVDAATKRAVLLSYVTDNAADNPRHPGLDPGPRFLTGGAEKEAGPRLGGRGDGGGVSNGRPMPIHQTLAIGDGANDIPMIEAAGLGIAYHAKPKTAGAADARVCLGDLSVVIYALGLAGTA
jgi:phosphoserine phosphatase